MPITNCPACEIAMEVQNFEDVLIDMCPSCRGVWLDRGEMQKIIAHVRRQEAELSGGHFAATPQPPAPRPPQPYHDETRYPDDRRRRKKKKGLWDLLEDIID